jgi:hypothetical protein
MPLAEGEGKLYEHYLPLHAMEYTVSESYKSQV